MTERKHPEREVQQAIRDWWQLHGYVRKVSTTGVPDPRSGGFRRNPAAGMADLVGVYRAPCPACGHVVGRFMAVEVKGPRGQLRPDQGTYLDLCRGAGGLAFMARSFQEAMAHLEEQLEEETLAGSVRARQEKLEHLLQEIEEALAVHPDPGSRRGGQQALGRFRKLVGE